MDSASSPTFSVRPESFDHFRSAIADRYQIEREAGRGGMATVYLARDLKLGRHVAIKVLHEDYATAIGAERFLREISTVARLQHPHIVGVHDSGEAAGLLYYVMPYVEGETLRERLNREKQLPIEEAVRIAQDVAGALAFAHIQGVVHRDIKPENILLGGTNACVADFGIARAIHSAGEARLTSSGLSAGTPAYMSPEQAAGERDIDGRADVYSLGCMLFEMLAGVPPYHGATAQAVLTRHMTEPPPRVRSFRSTVPPALERVLVRAMAKVPADRFTTAGEVEAALGAAMAARDLRVTEPRNHAKWAIGSVGFLAAAIAALVYTFWKEPTEALADTISVLPFEHSATGDGLLDGDHCQVMLHDALAKWKGIRLVNTYQLNDARAQRGNERLTSESRFAMARRMGSRRAVWGHVRDGGGAIEVRAAIYDVERPTESAREYTVRVKRDLSDAGAMFDILADSLVAHTAAEGEVPSRGANETTNFEALSAYLRGQKALSRWDVRAAAAEFRKAAEIDPDFASAHLWQAQTFSWTSDRLDQWRPSARRAATLRARLGEREQLLADALLSLASEAHPAACEKFGSLVARDSNDFAAWYGLGECHANDRTVIRAGNPPRWHFRGSYYTAVNAYREALERVPSAHLAFRQMAPGRLATILFTESNRLRSGVAGDKDTIWFGAFPSIAGDTLAFFPSPLAEIARSRVRNGEMSKAGVTYTRGVLKGIAEEWVRAFPGSADAHATVATVLETSSQLEEALASARNASAVVTEPGTRLQIGLSRVRLLLKLERFDAARALADSMFTWQIPHSHETDWTAGLAALRGRTADAATRLQGAAEGYPFTTPSGSSIFPPRPLGELGLALVAYTSAGAPASRIASLAEQINRAVPSYYPDPAQQETARDALLMWPMSQAFPVLRSSAARYLRPDAGILEPIQIAFARGDTSAVRARLDSLFTLREHLGLVPGNVAIDFTYQEAWLLLAMGDTVAAAAHLDHSLEALPTLGTGLTRRVQEASALVRAMAMRAEIASKRGERDKATRWAKAVAILWDGADPELQGVVSAMRQIVREQGG